MRTTLDISTDILQAAKERARQEGKTIGAVISDLARVALSLPQPQYGGRRDMSNKLVAREPEAVHGFRPFPKRGGIVTNDLVNQLAEDDQ